jgi:hypothetical protein
MSEPAATDRTDEVSQAEVDEIEAERERRLDPDNRPDNAEVDNTDRDFDATRGQFTDSDPDPELGPFSDPD